MPIYEYKCTECGKVNEFLESRSGKWRRTCSHCGSAKLTRQFSVGVKHGDSKRCQGCSDYSWPHAGQ